MKLSVDDKVTIVNIDRQKYLRHMLGHTIGKRGIVIVSDDHPKQPYQVHFDDDDEFWYFPENLELIKEETYE